MNAQPTAGKVVRLLSRLAKARRKFVLEARDIGTDEALDGERYKRLQAIERKACGLFRQLVPLPEVGTAWGPMPARDNVGVWVGNVLWVLVAADPEAGFDEGLYPVPVSAIRRLVEVAAPEPERESSPSIADRA